MSDATPTFEQLLRGARASAVGGIYIELPAIVDVYDEDDQCVDATPAILATEDLEDGSKRNVQLPTVLRAPVTFPGAGGYRITFPISRGDVVMLRFASANLSRWLSVGGQSEAQDGRRHDLCSAVAYPGGHSFGGSTAPKTTAPTDAMVLHGPKLLFGGPGADDPVVRKSDLDLAVSKINSLIGKYNGHTHPAPGGATSIPTLTDRDTTMSAPSGSAVTFTE
jgi:hypothetical protein